MNSHLFNYSTIVSAEIVEWLIYLLKKSNLNRSCSLDNRSLGFMASGEESPGTFFAYWRIQRVVGNPHPRRRERCDKRRIESKDKMKQTPNSW